MNLFRNGKSSNLTEILLSRDKRAQKQRELIQQYALPLISLTLVIPGDMKKSDGALFLFKKAILMLSNELDNQKIHIETIAESDNLVEYSTIFVVDCPAKQLKQICYQLEESSPLGRLWDFDVIDPLNGLSSSREQLNLTPRKCLICNDNAKSCARSRKHNLDELYNHMSSMIEDNI